MYPHIQAGGWVWGWNPFNIVKQIHQSSTSTMHVKEKYRVTISRGFVYNINFNIYLSTQTFWEMICGVYT